MSPTKRVDLVRTRKERDDARELARKLWHALSLDHHGVNRSARQPVVREALDAYEMTAKNWEAS